MAALCAAPAFAEEPSVSADERDTEELAKKSQNPIADLISVPFQNNTNIHQGPDHQTGNMLNIQPVIPFHLNEDWNLITRTIVPVVSQVRLSPNQGPELGLGDTNPQFYFSPKATPRNNCFMLRLTSDAGRWCNSILDGTRRR
jgi:hypothetical protein